jgi:hypothetical protein
VFGENFFGLAFIVLFRTSIFVFVFWPSNRNRNIGYLFILGGMDFLFRIHPFVIFFFSQVFKGK